jgi:hypothetical protein
LVPSIGRIVHYRLNEGDVAHINLRRRHSAHEIAVATGSAPDDTHPVMWQDREGNPVQQQGHTYDPAISEGVWFEPPRIAS